MLGMGCPFKGSCRAHMDGYDQKTYCNHSSRWRKCPHRPINDGNRQVQTDYTNNRRSHDNTKFGQILILLVFGIPLVLWLISKLGIL